MNSMKEESNEQLLCLLTNPPPPFYITLAVPPPPPPPHHRAVAADVVFRESDASNLGRGNSNGEEQCAASNETGECPVVIHLFHVHEFKV
ncbi:hypothetical protein HID58_079534 [Brassica napus]|uniref:Uncharacterized protein n=1 Tax=Brassica napus TaxID=3708 RepID=A0ABQ7Y298_BRANA|nr:hypothetical protein HID58_079534 [Brassica napus]